MELWISRLIFFMVFYMLFFLFFTFYLGTNYYKKIMGSDELFLELGNTSVLYIFVYLLLYYLYIFMMPVYNSCLWFLLWIFVFWLIIKYIIPVIILIPIPMIPFIIPIPIRQILLDYVPPFKALTDAGILPLMEKVLFTIISPQKVKRKLQLIAGHIIDFIKTTIERMFSYLNIKEKLSNAINNYTKDKKDNPEIPKENKEENKEYQKEIDKRENKDFSQISLNFI